MADLRTLLGEQMNTLRSLERIIKEQREFLMERDISGIISSITEQGQCLEQVHRIDSERKRMMGEISGMLGLGRQTLTIRALSQNLEGDVATELRATGEAIRGTLDNIGRVNKDNKRLIQHSLKLVQEMLGAATGSHSDIPTYGGQGTMRPHRQERMLVDRET